MKFSVSTALSLSLVAAAARADDVVILDMELNEPYTLFDPEGGHAELVGKEACELVDGEAIHATLPYVTGANIECAPGTDGCAALRPPHYPGGEDRWLVTRLVVPNDYSAVRGSKSSKSAKSDRCPHPEDIPAAIKKSLGVQFYKQDSRGEASQPAFFGRMDASRGEIETEGAAYTVCLKVPLYCMNAGPSFEGWTGISYQNRPLVPEDCEGALDFYIDSIKVSAECPFEVEDEEDLDPSFCRDVSRSAGGDDDWDYRGVCEDKLVKPFASALLTK